jgi:hypothetical protein
MRLVADETTNTDGRMIALRAAKDLDWFADWFGLKRMADHDANPTTI